MLTGILLIIILALSCADYLRRKKYKAPNGLELPPGPPGKPFVGHFFDLPNVIRPTFMYDWKKKYGDIVSINIFGLSIVFIYSEKIARELIEKRGSLYSDRPSLHMAMIMGWTHNVVFMKYGDWWRRHIRAFHQFFNSKAVSSYESIKLKARRQLLQDLLETPENFSEHLKYSVGRVIMDVVYAIDIQREDDPFMNIIHTALEGVSYAFLPGLWLVDVFPSLNYIPDWLPGLPFKNFAYKYRGATEASAEMPFKIAKDRNSADHSFVYASLQRLSQLKDPLPDEEVVIKYVAGTAYGAGASTTYVALLQAVVASILYPDAQEKMHDELDKVLGDRLPTLADRKDLPYVNAFLSEILRWRPPLPLGIPHAVLEDDICGDYFIPKGSIVIADSWQILRDTKYGPDPERFDPERFTQPETCPPIEQFGFGRRLCPGRFFAENTLFLLVASIFKAFNIIPMKDENGNDIPVTDRIIESLLPLPEPFKCSFKLRTLSKELILDNSEFESNM